jgi:hypothetical protein
MALRGRSTRSRSVASGWSDPPAPQNAVEAKNSHTAATTAAATGHQGQPRMSCAATPTTTPIAVAAR